jgi:hypothetical protein
LETIRETARRFDANPSTARNRSAPISRAQRGLPPLKSLRSTIKALIVANNFLETELEKLRTGYARLPRDRKDWYD